MKIFNNYRVRTTGTNQQCFSIFSKYLSLSIINALLILLPKTALASEMTEDPYIVEIYETYCMACHATSAAGAPVAFDAKVWSKRLNKGIDKVVNSAISGSGNMPAQGGCMECSYEDFQDLVNYMASEKKE